MLDAYYHLLSRTVPRSPAVRSRRCYRALYERFYLGVRKPTLGLLGPDPVLGWRNRTQAKCVHPAFEFRATYTTDGEGCRVTGSNDGELTELTLLGCSWTFGHGVNDPDTFAWRLARDHGREVRNLAVMGYGPVHAYLQLTADGWLDRVARPGAEVRYVWIPEQLMRAWRRAEWIRLNAWVNPDGPSHPVVDLEDGELVHRGLVGERGAATVPAEVVRAMEWRITVEVFGAIHRIVGDRGGGFRVVLPPLAGLPGDRAAAATLTRLLDRAEVPYVDLGSDCAADRRTFFYPFDGHPRPAWHQYVADALQ